MTGHTSAIATVIRRVGIVFGRPTADSAIPRPLGPINPFEAWLLLAAAVQGVLSLTGAGQSLTIEAALPPLFQLGWAATLLVGGVLSVAGLFWAGDGMLGLEVKRVGLVAAGVAALAYAVALLALGTTGSIPGTNYLCYAIACAVRVWQIGHVLNRANRFMVAERKRRHPRAGGG